MLNLSTNLTWNNFYTEDLFLNLLYSLSRNTYGFPFDTLFCLQEPQNLLVVTPVTQILTYSTHCTVGNILETEDETHLILP